jgi:S-phase kinase-associated protein 1
MNITFISSDGVEIRVERGIAEWPDLIRELLRGFGDPGEPIPIPDTEEFVLRKVLEWCAHHQNDLSTSVPKDDHRIPSIDEWDHKFMAEFDSGMLCHIIRAANFLDIKLLVQIGCRTIADMTKGRYPDEIRQIWNLQKDFTPEEIYRENVYRASLRTRGRGDLIPKGTWTTRNTSDA